MAHTAPSSETDRTPPRLPRAWPILLAVRISPAGPAGGDHTTAILAALICGRFLADGKMKYGAALVLVAIYGPLVFFDLPAAFALWTANSVHQGPESAERRPKRYGSSYRTRVHWHRCNSATQAARTQTAAPAHHRDGAIHASADTLNRLGTRAGHSCYRKPGTGGSAQLAFLIVMTTPTTVRGIGLIALAFVIGAAVAAVIGLASGASARQPPPLHLPARPWSTVA